MLEVKEIADKKIWADFLDSYKGFYPLFQTWDWGEVQKKLDFPIYRLGLFNNNNLIAITLIIDIKAKRGHYLHLRHGPVFLDFDKSNLIFFINYIKQLAKQNNVSFIRMSPLVAKELIDNSFMKNKGFLFSPIHNMDSEICWVLNVELSEEELLKNMRKSHRYLIKKAQASKIKIIQTKDPSKIDLFLSLYKDLAARKHFVAHRGVKEEYEIFAKDNEAMLFLAEYDRKIIAGSLIDFVGDMAIYRHSSLDKEYKFVPAMNLLLWEAILEAKKRGKKIFNFWGIAENISKSHPWYGLSLFKMGFGGEKREFLHAQDLPLNIWYWKTYLIELAAKIKKGY